MRRLIGLAVLFLVAPWSVDVVSATTRPQVYVEEVAPGMTVVQPVTRGEELTPSELASVQPFVIIMHYLRQLTQAGHYNGT
jgi:hypothetical protein